MTLAASERVSLRTSTSADEAFLRALFAGTRPELALLPPELVEMQHRAQDDQYRRANPDARFDIVEVDGQPVGRLYVDRRPAAIHVIDISLLPAHRGTGLGSALIGALQDEATHTGRAVTLHVTPTGPVALYERLGFRPAVASQDGIYRLLTWSAP